MGATELVQSVLLGTHSGSVAARPGRRAGRTVSRLGRAWCLPALVAAFSAAAGLCVTAGAGAQTTPIVGFGDSITLGLGEPGVLCSAPVATAKGYADHLEDSLVDAGRSVGVYPRGLCGEETGQGISRIGDVLAEPTFGDETGVVIIMEGTNDVSRGNPQRSIESIAWNLQQIAGKVGDAGWTPVYSSIIPYGPSVDGMNRNGRAELLAETLEDIAAEEGRPFADPFHDLLAVPDLFDDFYVEDGFHLNAAGYEVLSQSFVEPSLEALDGLCQTDTPCVEEGPTLCLQDGRFEIEVEWKTVDAEGVGFGEPQTSDTGKIWFFGPDNLELLVKVLDARCLSGHFWVFYGALTNQQFTMTVTDKTTCARRVYFNPDGQMASVGDTGAFPVPPEPGSCP